MNSERQARQVCASFVCVLVSESSSIRRVGSGLHWTFIGLDYTDQLNLTSPSWQFYLLKAAMLLHVLTGGMSLSSGGNVKVDPLYWTYCCADALAVKWEDNCKDKLRVLYETEIKPVDKYTHAVSWTDVKFQLVCLTLKREGEEWDVPGFYRLAECFSLELEYVRRKAQIWYICFLW